MEDDRVKPWDTSRWPIKPWPAEYEDQIPDDVELGPEDALEMNRHREYERGREYEVFVRDVCIFPGRESKTVSLRRRVFERWEEREDGRWPVFVTKEQYAARQRTEMDARLGELAEQVEKLKEEPECLSVAQVAEILGVSDKTVRKLIHDRKLESFTVGKQIRVTPAALESLKNGASKHETNGQRTNGSFFNPNLRKRS